MAGEPMSRSVFLSALILVGGVAVLLMLSSGYDARDAALHEELSHEELSTIRQGQDLALTATPPAASLILTAAGEPDRADLGSRITAAEQTLDAMLAGPRSGGLDLADRLTGLLRDAGMQLVSLRPDGTGVARLEMSARGQPDELLRFLQMLAASRPVVQVPRLSLHYDETHRVTELEGSFLLLQADDLGQADAEAEVRVTAEVAGRAGAAISDVETALARLEQLTAGLAGDTAIATMRRLTGLGWQGPVSQPEIQDFPPESAAHGASPEPAAATVPWLRYLGRLQYSQQGVTHYFIDDRYQKLVLANTEPSSPDIDRPSHHHTETLILSHDGQHFTLRYQGALYAVAQ